MKVIYEPKFFSQNAQNSHFRDCHISKFPGGKLPKPLEQESLHE